MAIMLAKTYAALKAAGAPEGDAVAAAEELADYENRLTSIDSRLALIEGRLAAVEARVTNLENGLNQFRADVNARFTMLTWAIVEVERAIAMKQATGGSNEISH